MYEEVAVGTVGADMDSMIVVLLTVVIVTVQSSLVCASACPAPEDDVLDGAATNEVASLSPSRLSRYSTTFLLI